MNGELDVAGADKVKEHLNGLVDKKTNRHKNRLYRFRIYRLQD